MDNLVERRGQKHWEALNVGVLALQGAFVRHMDIFSSLGAKVREVRNSEDLAGLDALVLPGGESTAMSMMMERWGLRLPLQGLIADGLPVLGTCAGLVLLANRLPGWHEMPRLGGLDVAVNRNAYGRQIDSFEALIRIDLAGARGGLSRAVNGGLGNGLEVGNASGGMVRESRVDFKAIFIRAPRISCSDVGNDVEVLGWFEDEPVLVREGAVVGASFHPELSGSSVLHEWFLNEIVCD